MQKNDLPKPDKAVSFPESLNPALKGRDYCLQMCQATYFYNWNISGAQNAFGNPRRGDWIENRNWAIGNPNVKKFAAEFSTTRNGGNMETFLNLDLKPLTYIPKFRDICIGYAEKNQYDVVATAINPDAVAYKDEQKWRIFAGKKLQGYAEKVNALAQAQVASTPDFKFDFDTKEELDVLYNLTVKMAEELQAELANEVVLNENDWKEILKKILEDGFDNAAFAIHRYVNPATGRVQLDYMDIVNMVMPEFRGHYLDCPERIGNIDMVSVTNMKTMYPELSDADYEIIYKQFNNKYKNVGFPSGGYVNTYVNTDSYSPMYGAFGVPVMTLYWLETDRQKYVKKVGNDGNAYTVPTKFSDQEGEYEYMDYTGGGKRKKVKKVTSADETYYYQCKWVVGTNIVLQWGRVNDNPRNPKKPEKPSCPIKFYRISQRSLLERLLPFEEANIRAWYKLQNTVAKAVPSGYAIDLIPIENTQVDGKSFPAKTQLALYEQTGRLLYKSKNTLDEFGRQAPSPIQMLPSALINDIQAWMALFEMNIAQMEGVSGINSIMAATTPNPKTAVGVANLAANAADNALSQFISSVPYMQERLAYDIIEIVKMRVKYGDYTGYADSLGMGIMGFTKVTDVICPTQYGIKIEARATQMQREQLKQSAHEAVVSPLDPSKGGLTFEDEIYLNELIDSGTNLKICRLIMKKQIEKNVQTQMQIAQQTSQANSEQQNKTIEIKAQLDKQAADEEVARQKDLIWTQAQANAWAESQKMDKKTIQTIDTSTHKSDLKKSEKVLDTQLKTATGQ